MNTWGLRTVRLVLFVTASISTLVLLPVVCERPVAAGGTSSTAPPVLRPAPDYTIKLTDGRTVSVSMFRGKVVIVDVIATHCPRCLAFTKILVKVFDDYRPRDLQILAAAVAPGKDTEEAVKEYITNNHVLYPLGLAPLDSVYDLLNMPKDPTKLFAPHLVIIDRDGRIRGQFQGLDLFFEDTDTNLRKILDTLIAESQFEKEQNH